MTLDSHWLDEQRARFQRILRTRHIIVVHSGALHGDLLQAMLVGIEGMSVVDANELVRFRSEQVDNIASKSTTVIVDQVDDMRVDARVNSLAELRKAVMGLAERDVKVCLVCTHSPQSFPDVPGSSILLLDSYPFVLPLCPTDTDDRFLLGRLAAARSDPKTDFRLLYCRALQELSTETILEVERVVCELKLSADEMAPSLSSEAQTELLVAGFLIRDAVDQSFKFSVPARYVNFQLAVEDTLSEMVESTEWLSRTYNDLYLIERTLRSEVRKMAIAVRGAKWRVGLIQGSAAAEAVRRAQSSQLVDAIESIRDPLEWITMSELLEVIRSGQFAGFGLDGRFWDRFVQQVIPVRNRMGHMRLVSKTESQRIHHWRLEIAKRPWRQTEN